MKHSYIPVVALSFLMASPFSMALQTIKANALEGTYTQRAPVNPNDFTNNVLTSLRFGSVTPSSLVQQVDASHFKVTKEGLYSVTCNIVLINHTTDRPFDGHAGMVSSYLGVNDKRIHSESIWAFQGSSIPGGLEYLEVPIRGSLYLTKSDTFGCFLKTYGTRNFANLKQLDIGTDLSTSHSYIQVVPLFPAQ